MFPIPMRGSETITQAAREMGAGVRFPIPIRGSELAYGQSSADIVLVFPIPMRGSERRSRRAGRSA